MSVSQAQVGTLYIPNHNNVPWSQPGGKGTTVYPQEQNGPFLAYPVPGQFFTELTGLFAVGCGHSVDQAKIWRDYDDVTESSVAIVGCPMCSFIQYLVEPYELIQSVIDFPIVII